MFTLVVLIFAEVMPKTLAAIHPERLAYPASYIYYPLQKIAFPLIWMINVLSNSILQADRRQSGRRGSTQPDDRGIAYYRQ